MRNLTFPLFFMTNTRLQNRILISYHQCLVTELFHLYYKYVSRTDLHKITFKCCLSRANILMYQNISFFVGIVGQLAQIYPLLSYSIVFKHFLPDMITKNRIYKLIFLGAVWLQKISTHLYGGTKMSDRVPVCVEYRTHFGCLKKYRWFQLLHFNLSGP